MQLRTLTVLVAAVTMLMLPTAIEAKKGDAKSCLDCGEYPDDQCKATCVVDCQTCPTHKTGWIHDKCEKDCKKKKSEKKPEECKCGEYDEACKAKCKKPTPKPTTKAPKPTTKAPTPTPAKTPCPKSQGAKVQAPDYRQLRA